MTRHGVGEVRIDVAAGVGAEHERQAEVDRARRDRGHDRLQAPVDHERAVDGPTGETREQDADDAERHGQGRSLDDGGSQAIGQNEDGPDRQVDAGRQNHERLADRHKGQQHAFVGGGLHHIGAESAG